MRWPTPFCLTALLAQPAASQQPSTKAQSQAESERANRDTIQMAVSRSLSELNESTAGRLRLSIRLGSDKPVFDVSFSPGGRQVVVVQDVSAVLYDVESGVELKIFRHSDIIVCAAFSPDGRRLVTGSIDKTARVWNVRTGREIRRLQHPASVSSVAFSPDGTLILTGSADQSARVWSSATGALLRRFRDEEGEEEDREEQPEEGYEAAFAARFTHSTFSAVFSGKGQRVVTGDASQTVRIWDIEGHKLRELDYIGFEWGVRRVLVSPDGRRLLTESDKGVQMWEGETGEEVATFEEHMRLDDGRPEHELTVAAFSPDGRSVLGGYAGGTLKLVDLETWKVVQDYQFPPRLPTRPDGPSASEEDTEHAIVTSLAFSADGARISAGTEGGSSGVWDTSTGRLVRGFEGNLLPVHALDVSNDGRYALVAAGTTGYLWDLRRGHPARQLLGHTRPISGAAFSADGALASTTTFTDGRGRLWTVRGGSTPEPFDDLDLRAQSVAFSPDVSTLLIGGNGAPALWDIRTSRVSRSFEPRDALSGDTYAVTFSRDGLFALTGLESETALLWDVAAGKELLRFDGHTDRPREERTRNLRRYEVPNSVTSVAFSADGAFALTGSRDNTARIWRARTGVESQRFTGHSGDVTSARFSPDGRRVLTASADSTSVLWDAATGRIERVFAGHRAEVTSAVFLAHGTLILTGSRDGTVRLWQTSTGKELCSLISFLDGGWLVITPDGRFDTNSLEEVRGLNWIAPEDPLHPLPVEIFVRDYYEPRLLTRLLNGETLLPIRNVANLNRLQPHVSITSVTPERDQRDMVSVTVEVRSVGAVSQTNGRRIGPGSGVHDVRLFRKGQLVGQSPPDTAASGHEQGDPAARLNAWRMSSKVKLDPGTGKGSLTFRNIRLPHGAGAGPVEFSAYAFNSDRVRSAIARRSYEPPEPLLSSRGRAYVITVGVNASENPKWDLRFAVSDAELMQRTVAQLLEAGREFEEVVPITLVSRFEGDAAERRANPRDLATKANLKAVIDLLAEKTVEPEIVSGITNGERLHPARPEDLVLMAVASHGTAKNGRFFLAPYDIGHAAEPQLSRFVSSEELSLWLRAVDAGEMALIVDACESRASFEAGGYKPGPMGDRGLGQLAYDKGMRILAASQDKAIESDRIRQGLLTYALVQDGLIERRADHDPKDGVAYLAEWLSFGVERVPELFDQIMAGEVRTVPRSHRGVQLVTTAGVASEKEAAGQQPSLFDFAKRKEVRLWH